MIIQSEPADSRPKMDWLIDGAQFQAQVYRNGADLVLSNGLIRRAWRLDMNAACVAYDNLITGDPLLRAVRPEAQITIDKKTISVGGLTGQSNHAYLTEEFIDQLKDDPETLRFSEFRVGKPIERLVWKPARHHAPESKWPPEGLTLEMDFVPAEDPSFSVTIHYQLYSGIPAISKWLTVKNLGRGKLLLIGSRLKS